jgi:hypothetical protein
MAGHGELGEALAPARAAFSFACSALSVVRSDLRERHRTSLQSVREAAQRMVFDAPMIGNPDPDAVAMPRSPWPEADEIRHADTRRRLHGGAGCASWAYR